MRFLHGAALGWLALFLAHLTLCLVVPRGIAREPLLPFWAKLCLVATEATAMALAAPLVGLVFLGFARLRERVRPRLRPVVSAARGLVAAVLLFFFVLSWVTFWLSGQFLNWDGLRFAFTNFAPLVRYAEAVNPWSLYFGPAALLAAGLALTEAAPRLLARVPRRAGFAAAGVAAACLVAAGVGEAAHESATREVVDPETGITYKHGEMFAFLRIRRAGPLTHAFLYGWSRPRRLSDGVQVDVERRPRIPMSEYLAGSSPSRHNVIVVVADSFRADHLRPDVMPALSDLARTSRVFTDVYTQASHTDYATPCIFSGHYPLRSEEIYRYPKDPSYPRVMIYDILKALGYRTGLFSSQNEEWGQMNHYMDTGSIDRFFHAKTAGSVLAGTIDDAQTLTHALEWLDAGTGPSFLYLNFQNSHLPYAIPESFPRKFGKADFTPSQWFPRDKVDVVRGVYADSLTYVDAQIARLVAHLRARDDWDRTILVVTSDHGEAFYEHGFAAHATCVYNEVMRVPLVIRAPGLAAGEDSRPAQLIDLPPTICRLLGLRPHPAYQGEDLLEPASGRSRYLVCATPWFTQYAIVRGRWKLMYDAGVARVALYDLESDPGERRDVSRDHPGVAADLKLRLARWEKAQFDYYENPARHGIEYPPVVREAP